MKKVSLLFFIGMETQKQLILVQLSNGHYVTFGEYAKAFFKFQQQFQEKQAEIEALKKKQVSLENQLKFARLQIHRDRQKYIEHLSALKKSKQKLIGHYEPLIQKLTDENVCLKRKLTGSEGLEGQCKKAKTQENK